MEKFPEKLFILERKGKLGLGTAYIEGFKWTLARDFEYCFEMDADFSHNPADLNRLLDACMSDADVAVGSRYMRDGKVENWPFDRLFLSRGASFYVQFITWMPIKDPTAGFICYSTKLLRKLDLDKIRFVGYAFQIEMKYACRSIGGKIREIPITFVDRQKGVSKMSGGIIGEAIVGVIAMRLRSFFKSYKIGSKDEH